MSFSLPIAPPTEEELDKMDLMESGIYDFEVLKSTSKISKSGNPMSEINVKVYNKDGSSKCFFDYLVFSSANMCVRKVKHFCETVGWSDRYESNNIPEEMEGLTGKLSLGVQEQKPNPNGGFYAAKNVVLDYIKKDSLTFNSAPKAAKEEDFLNDDLPF